MDENDIKFHNLITEKDEEILKRIQTWNFDFINLKGFNCLFKIYMEVSEKVKTFDEERILIFLLKIMKKYFIAAFSIDMKNIYRYSMLSQNNNMTLNFIS